MTTLTILEINCETGEQIERPMTEEEIATHKALTAESAAIQQEQEVAAQALAEAKASAEAKLAALGLTADEIAALSK